MNTLSHIETPKYLDLILDRTLITQDTAYVKEKEVKCMLVEEAVDVCLLCKKNVRY